MKSRKQKLIACLWSSDLTQFKKILKDIVQKPKADDNIDTPNAAGHTFLHLAAQHPDSSFLKELINHNANLNATTNELQDTAFHLIAAAGKADCIKYFFEKDKSLLSKPNKFGAYPIQYAAIGGQLEFIKELLKIDPSLISACDTEGTALHYTIRACESINPFISLTNNDEAYNATFRKHINCVIELFKHNIPLDKVDDQKNTALHLLLSLQARTDTAKKLRLVAVKMLLTKEETRDKLLTYKNNDGKTVFDLIDQKDTALVEFFKTVKLPENTPVVPETTTQNIQPTTDTNNNNNTEANKNNSSVSKARKKKKKSKSKTESTANTKESVDSETKEEVKIPTPTSPPQAVGVDNKQNEEGTNIPTPAGSPAQTVNDLADEQVTTVVPSNDNNNVPVPTAEVKKWQQGQKDYEPETLTWCEWCKRKKLGEIKPVFPKLPPNLLDTLFTAVKTNANNTAQKRAGVYLVGGQVGKVLDPSFGESRDIDLLIVGSDTSTVQKLLIEKGFKCEWKISDGGLLQINDSNYGLIDVVCIPEEKFNEKLYCRDYTVNAIAIKYPNPGCADDDIEIICPSVWLDHLDERLLISIDTPNKNYTEAYSHKLRGINIAEKKKLVVDPKTKAAIMDSSLSFTYANNKMNAQGMERDEINRVMKLRDQIRALFSSHGLRRGFELLEANNMLEQIKLPPHLLVNFFNKTQYFEYRQPRSVNSVINSDKDAYEKMLLPLIHSIQSCRVKTFADWISKNYTELAGLINDLIVKSRSGSSSQYVMLGMRFISCLTMAGCDLRPFLKPNVHQELRQQSLSHNSN